MADQHVIIAKEISSYVADLLQKQLQAKPHSTLGLATGSTPVPVYNELIQRFKEGRLSFRRARTFNLDEYVGLSAEHPQSYRSFMDEHLFRHIDLDSDSIRIPNGQAADLQEECLRYDRLLEQAGGVDWQLLGIGHNGHIGFNEPGATLKAGTHVVELSEITRKANARFFSSIDEVPVFAITLGMATILKARHIVLVASGEDKAEIVNAALHGPITTQVPASMLQLHPNVTVVLDAEAGSKAGNVASL